MTEKINPARDVTDDKSDQPQARCIF